MNDRWRRLSFGWCNRERRFTSLVRSTGLVVSARGAARSPRALCRGKKFVERWPKHASQCFRSMENWIEFSTSDDEIILRILDYSIASRDISVSPFLLFFFFFTVIHRWLEISSRLCFISNFQFLERRTGNSLTSYMARIDSLSRVCSAPHWRKV